jgi:hypothetical protein
MVTLMLYCHKLALVKQQTKEEFLQEELDNRRVYNSWRSAVIAVGSRCNSSFKINNDTFVTTTQTDWDIVNVKCEFERF